MKRRVLRGKANKRAMRVVSAAFALRHRDAIPILIDSSFARSVFESKGANRADDLHPLLRDCVGGASQLQLHYTTSTMNVLKKEKVGGAQNIAVKKVAKNPSASAAELLARQATCVDPNDAEPKREGRAIYEAAQKLLGIATAPAPVGDGGNASSSASARHVFVATQSHDIRKELQKAFPRATAIPREGGAVAAAPCSIIRATHTPLALWIDSLYDEHRKPLLRGGRAPTAAAAAAVVVQSPVGPSIGSADAAFMRKLAVPVPTKQLAPALQRQLLLRDAAQVEAAAGRMPRWLAKKPAASNPLASKRRQPKQRIIIARPEQERDHRAEGGDVPAKRPRMEASGTHAEPFADEAQRKRRHRSRRSGGKGGEVHDKKAVNE